MPRSERWWPGRSPVRRPGRSPVQWQGAPLCSDRALPCAFVQALPELFACRAAGSQAVLGAALRSSFFSRSSRGAPPRRCLFFGALPRMAAGALPRAATMSSCTHAAKYPDCGISRQIPESAKGYVSALRWAHDKCRVGISPWDTRALQQVLRSAQALMFAARRAEKDALLWADVRKLVRVATRAG